jgi:hypothetical protein
MSSRMPFVCVSTHTITITLGTNILNGEEVGIKVESVKARHPQLEYEARVYKALAGGGNLKSLDTLFFNILSHFFCILILRITLYVLIVFLPLISWYPLCALLWNRNGLQLHGLGSAWS